MMEIIKEWILSSCFRRHLEASPDEFVDATVLEHFRCHIGVFDAVSASTATTAIDLIELWSDIQPKLQHHLDDWSQCANAPDYFTRNLYDFFPF